MRRVGIEAILCGVIGALVLRGVGAAVYGTLGQCALRGGALLRTPAEYRAAAQSSFAWWAIGIAAMLAGRAWSVRARRTGRQTREGGHIAAPLLVPAVAALTGLGLVATVGFGDPLHVASKMGRLAGLGGGWPGGRFGSGVAAGGVVAGLLMAAPFHPEDALDRARRWLPLLILGLFVALLSPLGSGPGDTKINLWFFQPIELVKLAFVAFLASVLGRRAEALFDHRRRVVGLSVPRYEILLPAVLTLVAVFAGLFVVHDLGPILVLAAVFLALYYIATRSNVEVTLLAAVFVALAWLVISHPELLSKTVRFRIEMALDPWQNGQAYGDQVARALWAFAAGGLTGRRPGLAAIGALPAGHTDLILAHVAETLGWMGVAIYVGALTLLVLQGLAIAAFNRCPERTHLAAGLSLMLFAQFAVIFAGVVGLLPLTGIVVPLLSSGRTAMVAMMAAVGVLGRLAVDGLPVREQAELRRLRRGVAGAGVGVLCLGGLALLYAFRVGVVGADATTLRPLVTRDRHGDLRAHLDPRLVAISRHLPRGPIVDRDGRPLAYTGEDGRRRYPLGRDLGTLLGWVDSARAGWRPGWALEKVLDPKLRALARTDDGPAVWTAIDRARELRSLFLVASRTATPGDRARAEARLGEGERAVLVALPVFDYTALLPVARAPLDEREAALEQLRENIAARTVSLTLDARLQRDVAAVLRAALADSKTARAAAAVVIDVDSGEVLARAQAPDFDPADPALKTKLGDPRFRGVYGPLSDKTGVVGYYAPGSVFKLATALAAVRADDITRGSGCGARATVEKTCALIDGVPALSRPGWSRSLRDFGHRPHGTLELTDALRVSCNVYFGQLGLDVGASGFEAVREAGLEIGPPGYAFRPGPPGSRKLALTAIGQAAAWMHVGQVARLVAAIAGGGVYRVCDRHLVKGPCEERRLVDDPARLAPIIAGMRKVMESGTGRRLPAIPGLRVYGKTGTADAKPKPSEQLYGEARSPHAWFAGFAERDEGSACRARARGRVAVAVVLPRGGSGGHVAGPIAVEILRAVKRRGYFEPRSWW